MQLWEGERLIPDGGTRFHIRECFLCGKVAALEHDEGTDTACV